MVFVRARGHWKFGTTADIGIGASAGTAEALFAETGKALFSLMTDLRSVRRTGSVRVSVSSDTPEGLLVAFLSELIYHHDAHRWVFRDFEVRLSGRPPTRLEAECRGERWDPGRHAARIDVKAITMHRLSLDLKEGVARVIVDI